MLVDKKPAGSISHTAVTMADGVHLAVTLYLPTGAGSDARVPCLLEALPYRKDDITSTYREEYLRLRDEHGYAVARVDVRGTGSSEGIATDEYPPEEQRDLCDVIAWLAAQDWCSGSVGMYGTSYSGFNSLQVACEQPPALKAIIAIYATDDRYTDDVHYMGGVTRLLDVVDYPTYMAAMNAMPPVPAVYGDGWRDRWRERIDALQPWLLRWREEQRDSAYWRHGSVRLDRDGAGYDRIVCPTLLIGGWADGYRNNTFRTVERLRAAGTPAHLLLGPWAHASAESALPGPHLDLVTVMARWWDRWLREEPNGVDGLPALTWFAQASTLPAAARAEVAGEWRSAPSWPLPGAREEVLPLAVTTDRPDLVEYAVIPEVGTAAWNSCAGHLPWGQPTDQRYDDAASLTWEWPADGRVLLGHPQLRLRVASSQPVAFVSAKLCDVFPDGTSSLLARGLLNLTHRASATRPEPLPVGKFVDVDLELEAMTWVAAAGHRLRLSLAGTDWPNTMAPPEPVTLTVDRSASSLSLPVAGESTPCTDPLVLTPPASEGEPETGEGVLWQIHRDVIAGCTSCVTDNGSTWALEPDAGGGTVSDQYGGRVSLDAATFAQRVESYAEFTARWPEATARTRVDVVLHLSAKAMQLGLTVRAWEDDVLVGERTYDRTIARDLV